MWSQESIRIKIIRHFIVALPAAPTPLTRRRKSGLNQPKPEVECWTEFLGAKGQSDSKLIVRLMPQRSTRPNADSVDQRNKVIKAESNKIANVYC